MGVEITPPTLTSRPDGHWATCSACGAEFEVPVAERGNPEAKFVLSRDLDGKELEVTYGTVAHYDLSAYEAHYAAEHGEA